MGKWYWELVGIESGWVGVCGGHLTHSLTWFPKARFCHLCHGYCLSICNLRLKRHGTLQSGKGIKYQNLYAISKQACINENQLMHARFAFFPQIYYIKTQFLTWAGQIFMHFSVGIHFEWLVDMGCIRDPDLKSNPKGLGPGS